MLENIGGLQRGIHAWRSATLAVEEAPQVNISGVDCFVDGTYSAVLREDMPPMFVRVTHSGSKRWMYFDEEGRWRIALQRQKDFLQGGSAGFLRSATVAPGTLPASASDWETYFCADGASGWKPCKSCCVGGAAHECNWPDLVVTLHRGEERRDALLNLSCTNVGGGELAHLLMEPLKDNLAGVRTQLSEQLQFPKSKIKLVLPDSSLLSEELNSTFLADIFRAGADDRPPRAGSQVQSNDCREARVADSTGFNLEGDLPRTLAVC